MKKSIFIIFFLGIVLQSFADYSRKMQLEDYIRQFQNGDRSDSVRVGLLQNAKTGSNETLKNFLYNDSLNLSEKDNLFMEELTGIYLLKLPLSKRYVGDNITLFIDYVKLGYSPLMSDFYDSWSKIKNNDGIDDLKEYATQLAENYFRNYTLYYFNNYEKPDGFDADWLRKDYSFIKEEDREQFNNSLEAIIAFQMEDISYLMQMYYDKYIVPASLPKDINGSYFAGALSKLILIESNPNECITMIYYLTKKPLPKSFNRTITLFKGKWQLLTFFFKISWHT